MKKIIFLSWFYFLYFNQTLFAVDIELDGTQTIISGTDCQTAKYRLGTHASYGGESLDLIVDITQEDNEYPGSCVTIANNVLSFNIKDTDPSETVASMDFSVTVVKENTLIPVSVDLLSITNFDLDSSNNSYYTASDDV